jgi:DNA-binding SARP family transcriptional activator
MSRSKTDSQTRWLQLGELLDEGQYVHLAEHLVDFQTSIEGTNHPDLKNLTNAALQICVLCQQCQSEMEWHRKANQEVLQRVNELKGQLHTLLNLIVEYETLKDTQRPAVSVTITPQQEGDPPQAGKPPTLWQRIQDLFNFEPEPPTPGLEPSRLVIDASFDSLVEQNKHLAKQDDRIEEKATPDEELGPVMAPATEEDETSKSVPEKAVIDVGNGILPRLTLAAHLLGSFKLSIDDILLDQIPGGNSGVLLKYLLHHRKRSLPREELMELFWPGADPESARNRLNVIMSKVRKAIRTITDFEVILYENDRYSLNTELLFWVDVDEFEGTLAEATHVEKAGETAHAISLLEIAANLYQGDYMQEDIYEEWTVLTRERLRLANLDALYRLSRHYFEQEQYAACASLCHSIVEHDNCREDVHCLLMRCYARQGQYHLGLRQYQYCVDILNRELDVKPADSTVALYERLRRREIT